MDINEYMKRSLELQERTAIALEVLVKTGSIRIEMVEKKAGNAQSPSPAPTAQATAGTPSAQPDAGASAKQAGADAGNGAASTGTPAGAPPVGGGSAPSGKAPSVDDARAALQGFAKKQGNPAAMALLQKYGAKSVSGVPEEQRAAFVEDCK